MNLLSDGSTEEIIEVPVIVEENVEPAVEEPSPSTSATPFKPQKRARSSMPTIEDSGPSITPGDGGFIGSGKNKCITILFSK